MYNILIIQALNGKSQQQIEITKKYILHKFLIEHSVNPSMYNIIQNPNYSENCNQLEYMINLVNQLNNTDFVLFVREHTTSPEYRIIKQICMEYGLPFYEI